jgi:hypothetical protein
MQQFNSLCIHIIIIIITSQLHPKHSVGQVTVLLFLSCLILAYCITTVVAICRSLNLPVPPWQQAAGGHTVSQPKPPQSKLSRLHCFCDLMPGTVYCNWHVLFGRLHTEAYARTVPVQEHFVGRKTPSECCETEHIYIQSVAFDWVLF